LPAYGSEKVLDGSIPFYFKVSTAVGVSQDHRLWTFWPTESRLARNKSQESIMADRIARRHGIHEVEKGKFEGQLHVATAKYNALRAEISYLENYLSRRLLPQDPEDRLLANIVLDLQNVIEYELTLVVELFTKKNPTKKNLQFSQAIKTGFVSFKTKFTWARARRLVSDHEHDIMEQIRVIRNAQTHARPSRVRKKYRYFGKPLLARKSIIRLFTDVNSIVLRLRALSGNKERWGIIPPGCAEEMGWLT
jgi:hypothetical protein